jgi:hypothetical protein
MLGSMTDWDAVYRDKDPRLTEMHRGIRFWPRYDVYERVNDASRPVADRAHELLGHIGEIMKSEGRHIGMSWTDSPTMARQVAGEGGWSHHGETGRPDPSRPDYDDRPQRMPVVLNAAWPDKQHIEKRRRVLEHHGVYPYDDLEVTQGEIPLRHGAPADITGISWAPGDGERDQWTHHVFDSPVHYNGSEFEHPGRTASVVAAEASAELLGHFEAANQEGGEMPDLSGHFPHVQIPWRKHPASPDADDPGAHLMRDLLGDPDWGNAARRGRDMTSGDQPSYSMPSPPPGETGSGFIPAGHLTEAPVERLRSNWNYAHYPESGFSEEQKSKLRLKYRDLWTRAGGVLDCRHTECPPWQCRGKRTASVATDALESFEGSAAPQRRDGMIDLYHHTSSEAADSIVRGKYFDADGDREDGDPDDFDARVYFSDKPHGGQAARDYGPAAVHVRYPEGDVEDEGEADPGENWYSVPAAYIRPHHIVGLVPQPHEAARRPGRGEKACACCHGEGSHPDGSECDPCDGSGMMHSSSPDVTCPGQPQPRRRHWRQGAAEREDGMKREATAELIAHFEAKVAALPKSGMAWVNQDSKDTNRYTPVSVRHAGFAGLVGDQEREDEMREASGHDSADSFDEDLYDESAPEPTAEEQAHYEEHGEHPDSYYERHDKAYQDALGRKRHEDALDHDDPGLMQFVSNHGSNAELWHRHGTFGPVDLRQPVYATQSHVAKEHIKRYLDNPGDTAWHQQLYGPAKRDYLGDEHPMFVTHQGRLHAVEGHHRIAASLVRRDRHIQGWHLNLDEHPHLADMSEEDWDDQEASRHEGALEVPVSPVNETSNDQKEIRAVASDDTSYRMQHQGPDADDGEGMHEIGSGRVYPADIHQHPDWYGVGTETGSWDSWSKVSGSKGWPSRRVTMYRSLPSPHREINTGDWVTSSAAYAREHGRMTNPDDDWPVVKFEARADQLRNAGDSINEWSYHGPKVNRALVHFSGGKNHRGKGPRGGKADAALHEHEPPEMYEAYQAQTSEFRRKRKEERERKRSELESWANGQKEAAMDKHAISGETAPEGEDIFAEPTGRGPVHEHFDHLMEHPGESVRETPSGKEWVHPHLSAPDHGPYYVARKAEGDGFDSDSYQVLDRHGRTTGRSYGEGQMGGGRAFENAAHDWHRLTHRAEPPEDMPGYGEGSLWQTIKAHHEAKPPQFPHSRVDPRDAERVNRPEPRVHAPEGVSPSDEYHGSYEVVRHPDTGRYHVVDNAGRSAHVLPLNGHETQLQAERSRDYTEKRQQSKERARGIADAMYEGFHQIFDPGSTPESRESDRNLERGQDLMTRYEGGKGKVKFDSDEEGGAPYYEREHHLDDGRPSGWYVKHYGGTHADIYHRGTGDTGHDMMWLTRIQHPNGEESLSPAYGDEDLAADLKRWHDDPEGTRHYYENDKFGRQSEPGIHRWRQRHLGAAQAALVPEVIAHFASAEQTAAIAARSDPGYPNPLTGGHDWFHGTHSRPEDLNHGFDIRSDHDQSDEEMRGHLSYWNNFIGPHFAAAHSLADHFARTGSSSEGDEDEDYQEPSSRYEERSPQATVHARLKLRNPKVYASEHDMDNEAYEHETRNGNWISRHFEGYEDEDPHDPDYDPDSPGDDEEWRLAARFRHDDKQPLIGKDEAPIQGLFTAQHPGQRRRAQWLSSHPDKANIAARFRDRLVAQGHDGIVYGNELETDHAPVGAGPAGRACAIAFHPRQVEMTQHHETGRPCLPEGEAQEQMRRMPSEDQDTLPGAEEEADDFRGGFFRPRRASAVPDVIAHFAAAGPWMQQKLFHAQPDPTQHEPESKRHNPADPDQHLHWRSQNDEDYEPDECEHCGGDLKAERSHAEEHQNWLENQDWHTDWDADDLPGTLHRGIGVSLPDEVHQRVHDESLPVHERARALTDHLLAGESDSSRLGNFWSADPDVSKNYAESAARRYARGNDQTPVMFHIRTPPMEHIETDPDTLREWGVYSYHLAGNREVPIQHGAPLHGTGISWAPPQHGHIIDSTPKHLHEDPAWVHHDFGEGGGIRAQATAELVAHFDEDDDESQGKYEHPEYGNRDEEWGFYHHPAKGWHCHVCQDFHDLPDEVNDHDTGHTDWDEEYPRLSAEMHRGMALDDDGSYGRNLHYYRDPAHDPTQAARGILHHLGDFGTHWTDDEEQARHYSGVGRGRHAEGHDMNVVVHARKPAREDIETDPWKLSEQGVIGRDYHDDREIPLKGGAPVHVTGVSWKYHDEPDSAWRRHDFGDHGIQASASLAVEAADGYGPQPEYQSPPEGLSDDERLEHGDRQRQIRGDWNSRVLHGISTGAITPEHAKSLGYYFDGHQTDRWGDHTWRPLPRDLYHVTTDLPGVRASGLKTRDELAQTRGGHGLGGGPENMISLTDDHPTAQNILRSVHEFHHVVNGRYTPAQMWEDAKAGVGAARPFHEDLAGYHQSGWKEGDPLPRGLDAVLRQKEIKQGGLLYTPEEMARHHGPGWVPHRDADKLNGKDGRKLYNIWERDADPDRRREQAADFYKNFAAYREHAGGRENPVFFGTDTKAFAAKDPSHFAIVHARPRPGAMGHQVSALGEWRTGTGDAIEAHRAERLEEGHLKEAALTGGPDQPSAREQRGDRWHEYKNGNEHLHRGVHVELPGHLDDFVHDESVPREERAQALQRHFADSSEGLGMHWTPHVGIAQRAIWNAADAGHPATGGRLYHPEDSAPTTDVMFHVRRPGERNRIRDPRVLEEHDIGWGYSKDEDEFPLKPGSPLRLAGISWKRHELQYPNEPFEHVDFDRPIRHVSSVTAPAAVLPEVVAHFYEEGLDDDEDEEEKDEGHEEAEPDPWDEFSRPSRYIPPPEEHEAFNHLKDEHKNNPELLMRLPDNTLRRVHYEMHDGERYGAPGSGHHHDQRPEEDDWDASLRGLHPEASLQGAASDGDDEWEDEDSGEEPARLTPVAPERDEHDFVWDRLRDEDSGEIFRDPDREPRCLACSSHSGAEERHMPEDGHRYPVVQARQDQQEERQRHWDRGEYDRTRYCGVNCETAHAEDRARGIGVHHTFAEGEDEHDEPRTLHGEMPQLSGPHEAPVGRGTGNYEVRDPSAEHRCHYCRNILPQYRREGSLAVTGAYDWETDEGPFTWGEIAQRHPRVYGDDEDHVPGMGEGGGSDIADAAAELYHDRPSHPYAETTGELHPDNSDEMEFHPRTVDPSRIDYMHAEPGDQRVRRARQGYESQTPERVPPLILVHRHGVYYPADGNHRAGGAAQARKPVRAYVAYSPHEDEPFAGRDGEPPAKGPFHGAETEERPPLTDQHGRSFRISYPGFPHTAEVPRPMTHEAALETSHCGDNTPHPPHDGWCRGTTFDEYNAGEPGFCGNPGAHRCHGDCPGLAGDLPPRGDHGEDEFSMTHDYGYGHDPVFGSRQAGELVAHFEDRPGQVVYADVHDQVPAIPAARPGFWPGLQVPEDKEGMLEALREMPALVGVIRDELYALARRLGDESPLHPSVVDMIWEMAASCRTAGEDMGRLGIASTEGSWEEPGPGPKA